jgi:hypothetical protein
MFESLSPVASVDAELDSLEVDFDVGIGSVPDG